MIAPSPSRFLAFPRSPAGAVGAVLLFAASLTPSLLPRPWFIQAAVSGIGAAIGYGVGSGAGALLSRGSAPSDWLGIRRVVRLALIAAGVALLLGALSLHWVWLSDVRRLMDMEAGTALYVVGSGAGGVAAGYLLVVLARIVRRSVGAYVRLLRRRMRRAAALAVAASTLGMGTAVFLDLVVADRIFVAFDRAYLASSQRFDLDVARPTSPLRSGGPGSSIPWASMGRQGRAFVSQGPDRVDLAEFHGRPGPAPIRVYAGLDSGAGLEERVELAMRELERMGAFDRQVLVLVAPTGTGWVDPYAVEPLEYLYNGDTAAVAVQYSHRPSWVVLIGNQDLAIEASRALFEAVTSRMGEEPMEDRPRLLLYGESLGSFGMEAIFDDVDDVRARTGGVLWVGPPRANRIWAELLAEREADSPSWRPVYAAGRSVRFGSDGAALSAVDGPWLPPRIVYLQHASDPITWLTLDLMFRRPEWLAGHRGPDVSEWMPYVPVVTFCQVLVDLIMGTNAPVGHGHKFGSAQAEAWSLIAPPRGWTESDTTRLVRVVDSRLAPLTDD